MRTTHPSWRTLQAVEQGLAQFRDRPALLLWGGRDFCFHDRFLARWREIFPDAGHEYLADAGHYVLEDAREELLPRISRFLGSA